MFDLKSDAQQLFSELDQVTAYNTAYYTNWVAV